MDRVAARNLAHEWEETARARWEYVSEVGWSQQLAHSLRQRLEAHMLHWMPDTATVEGVVLTEQVPMVASVTDRALYLTGIQKITDQTNFFAMGTQRLPLDPAPRKVRVMKGYGMQGGDSFATEWRFEFQAAPLVLTVPVEGDERVPRALAEMLGWSS